MTIAAFLNTKLAFLKRHYFPELITLFVVFGVVGVFVSIYASTNRTNLPIPYQGRLLDSNYIPVADGTQYLKFAIYTAATGTASCVWESGSGTGVNNCNSGTSSSTPVTVNRGLFTVLLGDDVDGNNPPLPAASFNFETNAYYLGVTACGTANSCDAQMTPRRQIGGVPYAYNSDLFDGNDVTEFPLQATGRSGGRIITGGSANNEKLILQGTTGASNTATTSSIVFMVGDNASTTAMTILNNGFVGVGTTTPSGLFTLGDRTVSTTPGLTGAFLSFASSTLTDNGTAAGGTATNATFLAIAQGALTAQNAVTTTNAYTFYIGGAPTIGSNNTSTNAIALGIGAGAVGTQTNSYGLYVNAQTGATNNYAGVFTGGNVGVGTTSPVAILDVASSTLASGTGIRFSGPTSGTTMTGSALSLSSYIGNGGRLLNLSGTGSPASNGNTLSNAYSILSHAPSVTSTAYNIYSSTTDSTAYGNTVYGQYTNVEVSGDVNATKDAYGLYTAVDNKNTGTDQGNRRTYAGYFTVTGDTNGVATTTAVYANVATSAADTGYGFYSAVAGSSGTQYGLYVDAKTGAGSKYGVYVDVGTSATTRYSGIFLNGNFGIGTSTPQALLTIAGALSGTPSSSTGAYFTFATSTFTDNNTASGGTATSSSFITLNQAALASTNNVTTTNAYTLFIAGGPVKGANNTSTNAIALGIGGGNVGTQINSYGLYVTTQTGAANNYAATFMSGNVGIGTSTPQYALDLSGSGSGTLNLLRLQNTVAAANNSAAQILFTANRTTSGLTNIAGVAGLISDISDGAYKGVLTFSTANNAAPTEVMRLDNYGHLEFTTSTTPTLGSCGTSPSIVGSDMVGKVTIGSSPDATCAVTFANAWTYAPSCFANNETTATSTRAVTTASAMTIYNFAGGDIVAYGCMGRR